MRLLPTREVETHINAAKSAEAERLAAIRSLLSREEREYNLFREEIETKKKKMVRDFEDLCLKLNLDVRKLKEEISELEETKDKLNKEVEIERSVPREMGKLK